MAVVSTHLHVKLYQVAITNDINLPFRKWNHLGTKWCVSGLEAAYQTYKDNGRIIGGLIKYDRDIVHFSTGEYIAIGF